MTNRSYKQNCSLAHAADLIGERWTFLIFRELLLKPSRYGDLLDALEGMGTNLLSIRLKELEAAGLIEKADATQKRSAYQLTAKGQELEQVVFAMIRWGLAHGENEKDFTHKDYWDVLAMKAVFRLENLQAPCSVQFESEALTVWVKISEKGFEHGFGLSEDANLRFDCTIGQLQQKLHEGQYSDNATLKAFVNCFPLPSFS